MGINNLKEIKQRFYQGERPLFQGKNLWIKDTIFGEGESPLKHSQNIILENSTFEWKYPLWYSRNIKVKNSILKEMARAGIWYTNDLIMEDSLIEAPKEFRRCKNLTLKNISIPNAAETLWECQNVDMKNIVAKGDYFGMNCKNVKMDGFTLYGNYCFDGSENIEVKNSKFLSKDCFWNSENITIYDSYISGEYFAWNSKNISLINCTIESLQGMCFIDNLIMKNCKVLNTNWAFEYSNIDVEIKGKIDSILNPASGKITADEIGLLIFEKDKVNREATKIICDNIIKESDKNDLQF